MPEPTPTPPTIPDFRNRERYPERPSHHPQSYRDDFNALVSELTRAEIEPEVLPRPLANPALSQRCLLYTSPSPRDLSTSRMPSSA